MQHLNILAENANLSHNWSQNLKTGFLAARTMKKHGDWIWLFSKQLYMYIQNLEIFSKIGQFIDSCYHSRTLWSILAEGIMRYISVKLYVV